MARKKEIEMREMTITRLVEVPIQVQIPIACPKCRADFTEPDALIEQQYGPGGQYCYLPKKAPASPDNPTVADYGSLEDDNFEGYIVTGYACGECSYILANGEHTRAITPEIMRGLRFALVNVMDSDVADVHGMPAAVDMARAFLEDLGVPRG